jgi:hypothetical protein
VDRQLDDSFLFLHFLWSWPVSLRSFDFWPAQEKEKRKISSEMAACATCSFTFNWSHGSRHLVIRDTKNVGHCHEINASSCCHFHGGQLFLCVFVRVRASSGASHALLIVTAAELLRISTLDAPRERQRMRRK